MANETIPQANLGRGPNDAWPAEHISALGRVAELLERGDPQRALEYLNRGNATGAWLTNARAVCLLRLGQVEAALGLLRGLAVAGIGGLNNDAPTVFKANYATAQLLAGNMTGCVVTLGQTRNEGHPAVQRLRAAISRWRRGLSFWDRVRDTLGSDVGRAVDLGFPPGDL